jgi:hypothetical protein
MDHCKTVVLPSVFFEIGMLCTFGGLIRGSKVSPFLPVYSNKWQNQSLCF